MVIMIIVVLYSKSKIKSVTQRGPPCSLISYSYFIFEKKVVLRFSAVQNTVLALKKVVYFIRIVR